MPSGRSWRPATRPPPRSQTTRRPGCSLTGLGGCRMRWRLWMGMRWCPTGSWLPRRPGWGRGWYRRGGGGGRGGGGRGSGGAGVVRRSVGRVPAVRGVLWAGAASLPLDPGYPPERIGFMLTNAQAAVLVCTRQAAAVLPAELGGPPRVMLDDRATAAGRGGVPVPVGVRPGGAAYVMYTSGSTGTPKGVVVTHGGLVNYVTWCIAAYPELAGPSLLHTPPSFDAGVTVLYGALACGGTVVIGGLDADLPAVLAGPLTFLKMTPSHLAILDALPRYCAPAGRLMTGAEALAAHRAAAWRERHPGVSVVNHYGPTELTVGCAHYVIRPGQEIPGPLVPFGRPFANTRAFVLDGGLGLVPDGVTGELYVAGEQLARGDLGRAGVLARWRCGQLVFAGRADAQVKVRGFRVEPGEVAAVLAAHPRVGQAVVIAREDAPGRKQLVGYIVPADVGEDGGDAAEGLREYVAGRLPEYMVPAAIVVLDALPTTVNGKLDTAALPAPQFTGTAGGRDPATAVEEALCALFADVLGLEQVGAEDGFFDLGGDSLLGMRLVARVRAVLSADLEVGELFAAPSPAGLARAVGGAWGRPPRPPLAPAARPAVVPLSFAQMRL